MWRVKAAPPVVRTRTRAFVQCSTSTFLPSLHAYLLPPVPFPYSTRNEGPRATGYDNGYPMLVRLSFPPASSAVSFLFAVLFSFFIFFFLHSTHLRLATLAPTTTATPTPRFQSRGLWERCPDSTCTTVRTPAFLVTGGHYADQPPIYRVVARVTALYPAWPCTTTLRRSAVAPRHHGARTWCGLSRVVPFHSYPPRHSSTPPSSETTSEGLTIRRDKFFFCFSVLFFFYFSNFVEVPLPPIDRHVTQAPPPRHATPRPWDTALHHRHRSPATSRRAARHLGTPTTSRESRPLPRHATPRRATTVPPTRKFPLPPPRHGLPPRGTPCYHRVQVPTRRYRPTMVQQGRFYSRVSNLLASSNCSIFCIK